MHQDLQQIIEEMEQNLKRSIFVGWTDHATVQSWRERLVRIQQDLAEQQLTDAIERLR